MLTIQSLSCVPMCVKCRDVSECIAIWRTVPEADVDVERLEFACNRVATAAEGTTSLLGRRERLPTAPKGHLPKYLELIC